MIVARHARLLLEATLPRCRSGTAPLVVLFSSKSQLNSFPFLAARISLLNSPCAEGCLNKKILDEFGIMEEGEETWEVDSCGTGGGSPDW